MSADERSTIRLRLEGARAAIAELDATSAATRRLSKATHAQGDAADHSQRRTFLMNQALFTLRRFAYAGTLALTALTGAAVTMGFQFNASMENNTIAFEQFLGSARAATNELNLLYDIAKFTPFEFADVTAAARRFLAFGFTLQDTNKYLNIIGDTVAAFGGGQENIARMVLVFGQIRASGRLLGQDMLQLEQQGIPVLQILQEQLGLSADQLARIGELGISAQVGIPALMAGMTQMFGGAAAKQAQTFSGQISTLRDNISQLFGAMSLSAFNRARTGLLPALNSMFGDISDLVRKQKGKINLEQIMGIAETHFPFLNHFFDALRILWTWISGIANVFRYALWPAVKDVAIVFGVTLLPFLIVGGQAMQFLGHHATLLRILLTYLIAVYTAEKVALALSFLWKKRNIIADITRARWSSVLIARNRILVAWEYRALLAEVGLAKAKKILTLAMIRESVLVGKLRLLYSALFRGYVRGAGGQFVAMTRMQKLMISLRRTTLAMAAATRAWTVSIWASRKAIISFLFTTPVGWAILLIAALATLYWRWEKFRNAVNSLARWIWNNWESVGVALMVMMGPLGAIIFATGEIIKNFEKIKGFVNKPSTLIPSWVPRPPGGWDWNLRDLTGLAGGGTVTQGGSFIVGERGPEVAMLPAGASVSPIRSSGMFSMPEMPSFPKELNLKAILRVDGRDLAEVTAKHRLNAEARA